MAYQVHPDIYALARYLTRQVPPRAWRKEANALFVYVRDTIRYVFDPLDMEGLQAPDETLKLGSGDCDDKVMLLAAMLLSIGHAARMVAVKVDGQAHYSHVFLQVSLNNEWISLETTEPWPMGKMSDRITGEAIVMGLGLMT